MSEFFSSELRQLNERVDAVVTSVIGSAAEAVDTTGAWPADAMQALGTAGLLGLTVPQRFGGLGQGLLGMAAITESIGRACASTAMCFGMHCVAAAVMAAKATRHHEETYLRPIARGRHITTLALSESGSGSHFFLPQTVLQRSGDCFTLSGQKQFVTNGGHADSYVVSTQSSSGGADGEFSCLVLDSKTSGLQWGDAWHGLGMRGNSSRSLRMDAVNVHAANLLGEEGDQVWYVFEVITPYFLTAMAGTYIGVAHAALQTALQHLKSRRHGHSGQSLASVEVLQHRVGALWMGVEKSRLLLHHAARLGDLGRGEALTAILASKADAANTAVHTTNEALTLCGGMAYRDNSTLARLLRDARASHVMSPTTDMLTLWTGRSALGLSLF